MVTKYAQGRQFEYRIRDFLQDTFGYYVIRSAGSKGLVDLVALKPHEILLVQAKRGGVLPPLEWNALYHLSQNLNAIPLMAQEPENRGESIRFFRLLDLKTSRARRQPMEPFIPSPL